MIVVCYREPPMFTARLGPCRAQILPTHLVQFGSIVVVSTSSGLPHLDARGFSAARAADPSPRTESAPTLGR